MDEKNGDDFLVNYRYLETSIKERYNNGSQVKDNPIVFLGNQKEYRMHKKRLDMCKEIRNLLSHDSLCGGYPIIPKRELINFLNTIRESVAKPITARSLMVNAQNVCSAAITDTVRPIIRKMIENTYTHIPILDDGRVIGVFSENTLLSLFSNDDIVVIEETTTFNDKNIKGLLPLKNHSTECFRFASPDATIIEIREIFSEALSANQRVGLIFITQNGLPNNRILGIISPWDMPQSKDY
ncbi:CBS domain-containing protein [Candidatus Saccharibacteria bacterium]|nr:CBS domain-containing protein [Candidatus Saccharibacteria bacterium]